MIEKVSVLCSVYNAELYLEESIESVLSQSYSDFEFLIIDDASTDRSKEIVLSYKDKRIKMIENQKNIGLTASLNKGLKYSGAKYVFRQDADDISKPNRFEMQLNYLESYPSVVCLGSSVEVIDKKGRALEKWDAPIGMHAIKKVFCFDNALAHSSVCFDRKKVEELGNYNEDCRFSQDYDLWLRIYHGGWELNNLEEVLVQRRRGSSSFSDNKTWQQKKEINCKLIFNHLKEVLGSKYNNEQLNEFVNYCANTRYERQSECIPNEFWQIVDSIDSHADEVLNKSTTNVIYDKLSDIAYQLSALNSRQSLEFYSMLKKKYPQQSNKYSSIKIGMRLLGLRNFLRILLPSKSG